MSDPDERVRFLCDEDLRGALIRALRRSQPEMDIQTAAEAGTLGLGDPRVLAHAAAHGRVLLTHDSRTMPGHFGAFLTAGNRSPGIIIVPQGMSIGQAIQDIALIWAASRPEEYEDSITRLPL